MDLALEDSKSKEDDMGIIGVEVCLMHRDATIKKGPVRRKASSTLYFFALKIKKAIICSFFFFYRDFVKKRTR